MGKKKFIDKKKSATFQLMARDTSEPNYSSGPSGDRVFVRVDGNNYAPESFFSDGDEDPNSIFADAEDEDDAVGGASGYRPENTSLPEHIRREIIELGFPDDGYNYLMHMREIKNTGGGSAYYHNPKANITQLPHDVKAYDASRVEVSKIKDVPEEKSIYSVASKTVGVRLQKVVDPEIAALLDDSDSSKFGSDIEDLEEDFIVRANLAEGGEVDEEFDEDLSFSLGSKVEPLQNVNPTECGAAPKYGGEVSGLDTEKPRIRRTLDEQFDMLELQEYGSDNDEEYGDYEDEEFGCQESLVEKLNHALKDHAPAILHTKQEGDDLEPPELAAEVIRRCREYAEKYEEEDPNENEVFIEESSDESEGFDCETVISTYSNLDNHPGKIGAPEVRRKKKLAEAVSGASAVPGQFIALKGRERLPVDFLPRSKKHVEEKIKDEKDVNGKSADLQKRKPRAQESKEEKKERKSAIKSERREARQMKKEMKGLYKSEGQRAQKVAAFTGPSSIHLM